ncbi:hypothetical protein ACH4PR_39115 [Streptomyces mirabilis]|uniref:hypothetical protein n=1 Tax=Streptomyces mirabilis TaxID=68239 RepID=UPI0037B81D69
MSVETDQGAIRTNHVLLITRWRVTPEDCTVLNSFSNLRLTILVTHSGIDHPKIEPVDSTIAATSTQSATAPRAQCATPASSTMS